MNLDKRSQNQIRNIISVFENVLPVFKRGQPVDNWLSDYFRSNRNIGSKDRKRISNSIFGFFRWYGWIGNYAEKNSSLALLLGYLLDENLIDNTIHFWIEQVGKKVDLKKGLSLQEKCKVISDIIGDVSVSDLNPPFVDTWSNHLISAFQERPNLWIRLTNDSSNRFTQNLTKNNVSFQIHSKQKLCVEIKSPINLFEYSDYKQGYLEVQDIASQGVGLLCGAQSGDTWWDVCAGSGGKALHLSSLMNNEGKIYATEIHEGRFKDLKKRLAKRRNRDPIDPIFWNGKDIPSFEVKPVNAIVDAPCSCSGTWRRSPDLRWNISAENIRQYSKMQYEILSLVGKVIPQNGKLVYATCSIFEQENEQVVDRFLQSNPEFSQNTITCPFTEKTYTTGIRFYPPEINGNAMFVAVMTKENPQEKISDTP